jgi:hypothetical protein
MLTVVLSLVCKLTGDAPMTMHYVKEAEQQQISESALRAKVAGLPQRATVSRTSRQTPRAWLPRTSARRVIRRTRVGGAVPAERPSLGGPAAHALRMSSARCGTAVKLRLLHPRAACSNRREGLSGRSGARPAPVLPVRQDRRAVHPRRSPGSSKRLGRIPGRAPSASWLARIRAADACGTAGPCVTAGV